MRIGLNAGSDFWRVFPESAVGRLKELGAPVDRVPREGRLSNDDAVELIRGAEIVVGTWGMLRYDPALLEAAPDLRLVIYAAGSVKGFVTRELVDAGVSVLSAAHINAIPVAEFVLGIILSSLKGVSRLSRQIADSGPAGWRRDPVSAPGYYRTTVGLLGFGKVTRHLIKLLAHFDIDVLVEDPYLSEEEARAAGVKKATHEEVMESSDVVSIHHANVPQNWGLVGAESLALLRDGATLINTSRGKLVDEAALAEALQARDLTAYLDVTDPEPPKEGHPFYTLPNCILTPHVAGSYSGEVQRMGDWAIEQLERALRRESLDGLVDPAQLDSIA